MSEPAKQPKTLLEVNALVKHFAVDAFLRRGAAIRAVDDVSFNVREGEIFSIVGESGSGKSTVTRVILGLERPTHGRVLFDGVDIWHAPRAQRARLRRGMQPVFQDPASSLDPRWTVGRTVREALDAQGIGSPREREQRVRELLERVGLSSRTMERRPHELSGGQRQRVCIAAALAPRPRLLIADEPVTALDVSVQAQVLNLLHEIQRDLGLAILLVAHDLSVVAHISDRVAIMYLGRIVEQGPTASVFDAAMHPYTRALIDATPRIDRDAIGGGMPGEIPSSSRPIGGCRFQSRCVLAEPHCTVVEPSLVELRPDHLAACHVMARGPAGEDLAPMRTNGPTRRMASDTASGVDGSVGVIRETEPRRSDE